ncbi:hypothetical protein FRC12_009857 [Ceratobasidium sp. 428]|nr:hypothetical protein FRC12_009857 [Ceratobasidium sp. 428]
MFGLYIAPYLLRRRFRKPKYYRHFVSLIKLLKQVTSYDLPRAEIPALREGIVEWIQDFERYYYQNNPNRMEVCTVNIHYLLHLVDAIEQLGPPGGYWLFLMERFCSLVGSVVKSWWFPFENISRNIRDRMQLKILRHLYGSHGSLGFLRESQSNNEDGDADTFPDYPRARLLNKCAAPLTVTTQLRNKISAYLGTTFGLPSQVIKDVIPKTLKEWRRLAISQGVDTIQAAGCQKLRADSRDSTFVRKSVQISTTEYPYFSATRLSRKSNFSDFSDLLCSIYGRHSRSKLLAAGITHVGAALILRFKLNQFSSGCNDVIQNHHLNSTSTFSDMVLPSESPFDPKWGPTLNEYLDRPEANLDFPDLPDEGMVCLAMDNFLRYPAVVTFNTLETIMSALYRPAMFRLLVHEDPVGRCMELLEDYAHRNGPESTASLFEHAFGFLGLHVLALVLQIGLLDSLQSDYLKKFPRALTENTQCPWDLKAPAIQPNFIPHLYVYLAGDTLRLNRSGPLGGDYKIEWLESDSDDRDERACLPSIGGFMYRDAVFVLRQLFNNRKTFLECCFRTRAPGWSILVCMIQFMLDDRSYEGRRVPQLWQMHRDIVYRFSLVSGLLEDGFMETLCGRYAEQYGSTFFGKSTVVDFEDAQLIQLAFTRKHRPNENGTHKRDLTFGTNVTLYVRDSLTNYLPLQLAINETTTEVVWDTLLCVGHDKRWQDVDFYMGGSYGEFFQMLKKNQTDLTHKVIAMLHRFDVVSMFGRYILLPSYLQNCLPDVLNAAPTADPNVRQDGLMVISQIGKALGWVLRHAETPLFLDDYYPDWYKILLFIWREKGVYTWNSYLYKVTAESEAAWMAFGDGLGFTKHLNSRSPAKRRVQQCMYARCPDPEGARFESRSGERYCSARCQVAALVSWFPLLSPSDIIRRVLVDPASMSATIIGGAIRKRHWFHIFHLLFG